MDEFEELLCKSKGYVERFVKFKLPSAFDADDVIQEVYIAANEKFNTLKDKSLFKAWIIGIARNKCKDYFRKQAKLMEIPIEETSESVLEYGRLGITETNIVQETLGRLANKDQEILYLYFFCDLSQKEISKKLGVPLGTVKSRLFTAKHNFKNKYPYQPKMKGEIIMNNIPDILPDYHIEKSDKAAFSVVWEELMGWFLVPKLKEKLTWGMYDMPSRKMSHRYSMEVTGKAEVHGIEGVELTAREDEYSPEKDSVGRTFVAQLTDTHCRYLASMRTEKGIRKYITFLDDDAFLTNWGYGENNCGNETHISMKGDIIREGDTINTINKSYLLDIVGRYTVTIGTKSYDTVCVMDIERKDANVVSEQYLDQNGRTILWRRFNRDDWSFDHNQQKWSEKLPENERIIINNKTYVHWYDCITDYIL